MHCTKITVNGTEECESELLNSSQFSSLHLQSWVFYVGFYKNKMYHLPVNHLKWLFKLSIQSIILHQLWGDQLFSKCIFMLLAYISEILRSFRFLCISGQEGSLSLWLNFLWSMFYWKRGWTEKKTELCKQLILL